MDPLAWRETLGTAITTRFDSTSWLGSLAI
jgi:hypothetical protein